MTKKRLEKRYGVTIVWDLWNNEYKMYSADSSLWENGLRNIKACEKECKAWAETLTRIKARAEAKKQEVQG